MEKRIKYFIDMYFEDIPYSDEVYQAQKKIEKIVNTEYEKLSLETSKDTALEIIVKKYSKLSDMAVLAGYSSEDVEKWRNAGEVKVYKTLKKEILRQRHRIYLISFLWLCTAVYLIEIPLIQKIDPLFFAVIFGILALLCHFKYRKKELELTKEKIYDTESYMFLRKLSDKYAKRSLNGIALFFCIISIFLFSEISFYILGNSKFSEFLENIYKNIIFLEIPIYICIKNKLCFKLIQRRINFPYQEKFKIHLIAVTLFSAVYWLIMTVTANIIILNKTISYPVNIFLMAIILFAFMLLVYNLIIRKKITYKNIVINKKRISVFTTIAILCYGYSSMQRDTWYTQPYINSISVVEHNEHKISYNDETGVYTIISSTEDFKILHLTDIHLGGSLYSYRKDIKALKAVYAEIEHTKPDLVIVTGDLTFPMGIMSLSLNNSAPVNQFAAFMRNVDIPWAFTYGNHDTESLATLSKSDLNELYKSLSYKTSGNLLYPYVQPNVTGRNNQLIEIRNSNGALKQAIFLIDSNAYTGEGINVYDFIHDDQVEWYADEINRLNTEEGHTVSSMAFFHIPLQQYRTAYELYEQGSDEVTYFFGENGEKIINKVCCSDYPSKLFDKMVELESTKAVFCGHDHYNNMSLEYKGIRLTYGMSIDYLAMPGIEKDTSQRGAELITIHNDSSWDIEQIPLISIIE